MSAPRPRRSPAIAGSSRSAKSCSRAISAIERARRIARRYLPSREAIAEILQRVLDLMYPGYFGRGDLNCENLGDYVAQALADLAPRIEREMEHCLCYGTRARGERRVR